MSNPTITDAFVDSDSIAYVGACIAEKNAYIYRHKHDKKTFSEEFTSAKEGKVWFEGATQFGEIEASDWDRHTIIKLQDVSVALKGVEYELANWTRDTKRLTKNPDIKFTGYLTPGGIKTKDITGLEDRYQFNRYLCKDEWIKKPSPTHLKSCRAHLLSIAPWVKMAPPSFEADAPVIYRAEKMGYRAVAVSADKDIAQVMGSHFIDMNPQSPKLQKFSVLGELELIEKRSSKQVKGGGFKFICYQTIAGDVSDGYKGLSGAGPAAGFNMFDKAETVEECLEILLQRYMKRYPQGHTYTDWTGVEQHRTAEELVVQHMQLAYHERGQKDLTNPMSRYLEGEEVLVGGLHD